jgi:hypothetical protein
MPYIDPPSKLVFWTSVIIGSCLGAGVYVGLGLAFAYVLRGTP